MTPTQPMIDAGERFLLTHGGGRDQRRAFVERFLTAALATTPEPRPRAVVAKRPRIHGPSGVG